jgi:hypothetical protein
MGKFQISKIFLRICVPGKFFQCKGGGDGDTKGEIIKLGGFNMKKFIAIALVLVLTVCALTGCRSKKQEPTTVPTTAAPTTRPTTAPTTAPTTMPTTTPTEASTDMTGPSMDDLIPGTEDTVDPSSGANQDTRIGGMH